MSAPVKENRAQLVGHVIDVSPSPDLPDYTAVQLDVEQVEQVPGYANLHSSAAGTRVGVLLPNDLAVASGVGPGRRVSCRVRLAGPGRTFADREQFDLAD